ncbi:MAG: hypothetical protein E7256_17490 [Lachnospiraceae bacterium]|nr:hypothetical protein [Lachnospiraceae bacterium]
MSMDITQAYYNSAISSQKGSITASKLSATLASGLTDATDEELMDACKSFEAYLVEQVFTKVKDALTDSEEEENEYTSAFGDMLYQKYAEDISESGQLGIAQQLYESMKRG